MTTTPALEPSRALDADALKPQAPRRSRAGLIPLLSGIFGLWLALFLTIDPVEPLILLTLAIAVAVGTDGIVRSHPRGDFRTIADTSPFLFVPVLFTFSAGLFLEDVILGYWAAPAVVGASALLGASVWAEYVTVDRDAAQFPLARLVLNVITYLTAFGLYAVVYGFDVDLAPAALAVGLVSTLLAVEIFREAEADAIRALVFASVIGIIVAEARWVLYFLPLDGFLAGVFLLLVFYLSTGVISHHLTGHLDRGVLLEFMLVTAAGLTIVIGGRIYQ